nr:protein SABRE [Tanacetum cinerariifolium]
ANLCVRNPNASSVTPPKKEKSLPWWDEMRNYIHGKTTLCFSESTFNILATTDPYEKSDKLQISSGYMELQHSDGRIFVSAKDFKMFTSSLENLLCNSTIKPPAGTSGPFLVAPSFTLEEAKVFLNKDDCTNVIKVVQMTRKSSKSSADRIVNENGGNAKGITERHRDDGFLLSSDYFTIRRQSPKADPVRLLAWQEAGSDPSLTSSSKAESQSFSAIDKHGFDDSDEEGTRRFMVNVIEPQFNLHSDDANGRFLLAAVSGRVLARSFHAVLNVGIEMIKQALGSGDVNNSELTWNRMELSVMLEHVQAHVAPTDVDPGAGLQWLPKIRRSSPKVKPLKELAFNSQNITATMTSRQFQVMLDVLTNLLFARLPKPRRSSLPKSAEDDDDIEEEADE